MPLRGMQGHVACGKPANALRSVQPTSIDPQSSNSRHLFIFHSHVLSSVELAVNGCCCCSCCRSRCARFVLDSPNDLRALKAAHLSREKTDETLGIH